MLGDSVPLRVHWPRNTDLRMNNMMYKPYGRSTNAKLGANSRDDMASVGIMVTPVCAQICTFVVMPTSCWEAFLCSHHQRYRHCDLNRPLRHVPSSTSCSFQKLLLRSAITCWRASQSEI
jgi:hypothetical protein